MPIALMLMVLFITMLLSVFQQASCYTELVVYSMEELMGNQTTNVPENVQLQEGDLIVYSNEVTIQFLTQYSIDSQLEQRVRVSEVEERLRRWQLIGSGLSK
jgi:hypothetical protein